MPYLYFAQIFNLHYHALTNDAGKFNDYSAQAIDTDGLNHFVYLLSDAGDRLSLSNDNTEMIAGLGYR